jgi:hypothetical protein
MAGHSASEGARERAYIPAMPTGTLTVMAGLGPAIHVFAASRSKEVDARDKRGDDGRAIPILSAR